MLLSVVGVVILALSLMVASVCFVIAYLPTWHRHLRRQRLRRRRRRIEKKLDRQSAAVRAVIMQLADQLTRERIEASREMARYARRIEQRRPIRHRSF